MSTNQFKDGKCHTYLWRSRLGVTISLQIDIPILMRLAEASIHRVPPSSCYPLHRKLLNRRWTTTQLNNELVSSPKKNHQQISASSASDPVGRQSGPLPHVYSGPLSMKHTNFRDPPSHRTQTAHSIITTNGLKQETPEAMNHSCTAFRSSIRSGITGDQPGSKVGERRPKSRETPMSLSTSEHQCPSGATNQH